MRKLELTIPSERIIGFTILRDGRLFVCDHDEVWAVLVSHDVKIEETDFDPYLFSATRDDFVGWGEQRFVPLLKRGDREISYEFDPLQDQVTVTYSRGAVVSEIQFRSFSGDWFVASLSVDGAHLVMADPYLIELYELS